MDQETAKIQPKSDHPHGSGMIIKHIPRSARPRCAIQLTTAIKRVIADPNSQDAWLCLLPFGQTMFFAPPREGCKHNND
jgi:hypothetical protein